ncbi:MAG: amidohydrolase [Acidobacteriota bacterium]
MRSFLLVCLVACGAVATPRSNAPADLVLEGGDVRTMDPAHPHATAVAVRGDKIVAVGDDLHAWIGRGTRVVELHGATVTPGLVDAHCHLYELGSNLEAIDLRGLDSVRRVADVVADRARARRDPRWLVGRGWDQNLWPGQQFPDRSSIDAVVADRPVVLERVDGHAIWVNSAALQVAGITAQTLDPPGGRIVRDGHGEPTGVLIDNATDLVWSKLPATREATRQARILAAAKIAVSMGLTGIHEMGIERETARAYEALVDRHALPLRVYAFVLGDPAHPDAIGKPWAAHGRFEMRGVKFFADGALGSRGARLYEPYDDDPENTGLWVTDPGALARAVGAAFDRGWQVAIHAIGDAAIGSVLDAYQAAERAHPGDTRPRVEHLQVLAVKDLPRVVATHAIASMQPTHATSDMPWAEARVGKQRLVGAYAWRTMLDHHVPLAFGSDFPVEQVNPLLGIYAAVTRQDAAGNPPGGWYPAQRMTLDEAIAAFTRGAAYAGFAEASRGTLAVGNDADLTVFDRPLAADRSLLETRVQMTVVGGEIVYHFDKK